MPIRIAHHRKVTYDTAYIQGWLNQNVLLTRQLSNPIDFFATVALEAEVIEAGFHFILDDDQDKDGIFSRRCSRTEPDIVTAFDAPVANDRKAAERGVKVDGGVDVAAIDRDMCPASGHGSISFSIKEARRQILAARRFVQMSADILVGLFASILLAYSPLLN
jgi:hypothetical protein